MREVRTYPATSTTGETHVFEMGQGGPAAELHVVVDPTLAPARPGAGGVHHVAFRTPDQDSLRQWVARVGQFGLRSSGEVTGGPRSFSPRDRSAFLSALDQTIRRILRAQQK